MLVFSNIIFNGTIKELILSLFQAFLFRLPKYQCFYLETLANGSVCCQNNFIKLLLILLLVIMTLWLCLKGRKRLYWLKDTWVQWWWCLVTKPCLTLCNPMDCSPLSMGFPMSEYWSGLLFPPPGDLPHPGIEPVSPALAGQIFTPKPPGKPQKIHTTRYKRYIQQDNIPGKNF